MNDEMFRMMLKQAFLAQLQMQNTDVRKLMPEMFDGTNEHRRYLEHHPSIQTSVTDEDMLLLQIDHALDDGDEDRFALLTNELQTMDILKRMGVRV